MANKGSRHLNSFANDVFDEETYRNRVATHIDGNTVAYEDTSFVVANDQSVLDVATDLGRIATKGYIVNDGPGDMKIEVSFDGLTYGGIHTIRGGETIIMTDLKIRKIRLTWIDNTEYRALIG